MPAKNKDIGELNSQHFAWLIESRAVNQRSALALYSLIKTHIEKIKKRTDHSKNSQVLVAACFSLWRAAFLADKTGIREAALGNAVDFLEKMLADNAITYQQDKNSREWTFSYYVNAAFANLRQVTKEWPEVGTALDAEKPIKKGSTAATRRWDRHQHALDVAIGKFRDALAGTKAHPAAPAKPKRRAAP